MPEIVEEDKSEPLDLQRYLDVARRRYPIFPDIAILRVAHGLGSQLDSAGKI